MILAFRSLSPTIAPDAFLTPTTVVVGDGEFLRRSCREAEP
jgi:hypothetical protein